MKVLLQKNVSKLGIIGQVVDVKPGYARNYLIPQGFGAAPTAANIKAVEAAKAEYLAQVAKEREALMARAAQINGKEVTLAARANEEGHLYGSVGPAQIAQALAEEGVFVDPDHIVLDEPIRQLDKYEVKVRFAEDIKATIAVWVVPIREEAGEEAPAPEAAEAAEAPAEADDAQ
jgi:large subunit ribosomal protein L9